MKNVNPFIIFAKLVAAS